MTADRTDPSTPAPWRRLLLLPSAARLGAQAPRDRQVGWDQFWGRVAATGDGGDVLWDSSNPAEIEQYLPIVLQHLDPELPVVDLGCGNGRQSRVLAAHFPEVLAVDLSPDAIERARKESAGVQNLRFHTLDLLTPDAGEILAGLVGEANVFLRGVLHIMPRDAQLLVAAAAHRVLGARGRLFLAETNYTGDSLGYLHHLGARPGRIPVPLQRAISLLPKPRPFGPAELRRCFPAQQWSLAAEGTTEIFTIPLQREGNPEYIPGHYAVLRAAASGVPSGW